MAQILVKDLDEEVVRKLKKRAKILGRSLQAEVKNILEDAARREMMTMDEARRFSEEISRKISRRKVKVPDAADLIREDRDR
jgi:antitoxin FitA